MPLASGWLGFWGNSDSHRPLRDFSVWTFQCRGDLRFSFTHLFQNVLLEEGPWNQKVVYNTGSETSSATKMIVLWLKAVVLIRIYIISCIFQIFLKITAVFSGFSNQQTQSLSTTVFNKMVTCWAVKGWKSLAMWFLFVFVRQITVPGTLPTTAVGRGWIHPAHLCLLSQYPPSLQVSMSTRLWPGRRGEDRRRVHYSSGSLKYFLHHMLWTDVTRVYSALQNTSVTLELKMIQHIFVS